MKLTENVTLRRQSMRSWENIIHPSAEYFYPMIVVVAF